ncbi:CAP domain-containing protein [Lactobacillus acetotolerans]|uniref:CAP domain-containing protein n=1 Tax=Lactobacillus acetotolerans TaxID=1600 RepID=UPI0012E75027|nr:CAP domain-containing protein [Lactobacillus acetotolerans]QGV05192.1 CAP domain-containing protein [Lactobacillus acetotolerans]
MLLRKFSIAAIALIIAAPFSGLSQTTQAATFTSTEVKQVHHFQNQYSDLSKTEYDANNIYAQKPHLKRKFKEGVLAPAYINDQLAYINYYRSLFGLNPITENKTAEKNAQKTAAVMAAINANPFVNQHGLPGDKRPAFVGKSLWKLAQDTSETSNLNFNVNNESAGDVVTDLITDRYNLTGSDTGHRAWLLSSRLSSTGIGAAYGSNGYRYSVEKVLNVNDIFREASQPVVAYPSARIFPIELAKGENVAWSLYLSDKTVGATPIVAGHQYEINIAGVYKYSFKLFEQDTAQIANQEATPQSYQPIASLQKDAHSNSALFDQSAKLSATLKQKKNDSVKNGKYLDALKGEQWQNNFFINRFIFQND